MGKEPNTGKENQRNTSGTDTNSLDEMVNSLTILGFDKVSTVLLPDYKTQNTLEYGSRFNSIIKSMLGIKSGTANLSSLAELEKKVYNLYSEVNNDTFFGDINYDNERIGYNLFFPKVAEFLKTELNKLKQGNNAYTNFQNNLRKIGAIGAKGTISFVGCSELANFALSDYHRVIEEIMKCDTSPESIDLNKIYIEEIPQLQELVSKNKHKISGEVIYNGKIGKVSEFLFYFGEYLKNKIRSLDQDVGEREKIELIEDEIIVDKQVKIKEPLYQKTEGSPFDKKKNGETKPQRPNEDKNKKPWYYDKNARYMEEQ